MVLCGAIAALAVIIVGIILLAKGCSGGTDALAGTWEFDGTTTYSFDGSGSGAMELPSISYDFTYTIDGQGSCIYRKMSAGFLHRSGCRNRHFSDRPGNC